MTKKSKAEMINLLVEEDLLTMTDGAIRSYAFSQMIDWYYIECDHDIEELYERRIVKENSNDDN